MAKILKELDELVKNSVVDENTRQKILDYYQGKPAQQSYSFLQLSFGLIGSSLIGLGILLLIAYNWHGFSHNIRLTLAIAPLILSYGGLAFCLWRYPQKEILLQSFAILAFLSTGGAMALLGQIYQIQSEIHVFLRNWILLTLPLLFVTPRFVIAFFMGIWMAHFFAASVGEDNSLVFTTLFGLIILGYYLYALYKEYSLREVLALNILLPIFSLFSLIPFLDYLSGDFSLFFAFMTLFILWVLLGHICQIIYKPSLKVNMLIIFSLFACLITLYIMSYNHWGRQELDREAIVQWVIAVLFIIILFMVSKGQKNINFKNIHLLLFLTLCLPLMPQPLNVIAANAILIGFGLYYLIRGFKQDSISLANLGLFMLCFLIALRFFEVDISFMTKGIIFILIGTLFVSGNIFIGKQLKKQGARG